MKRKHKIKNNDIISIMITEYGNYISENPDYKYEDGIMNYDLFKNEKIKILWILRETHGSYTQKLWMS